MYIFFNVFTILLLIFTLLQNPVLQMQQPNFPMVVNKPPSFFSLWSIIDILI